MLSWVFGFDLFFTFYKETVPIGLKIHFLLKWIFEAQVGFLHLNSLVNCHIPAFDLLMRDLAH